MLDQMRRPVIAATLLLSLTGCSLAAADVQELRVLMIVGGRAHEYEALPRALAEHLDLRGEMHVELTSDLSTLTARHLQKYDVLVFNTCIDGGMTEESRKGVSAFVRSGKGLVAMHCALWSFQDWPEWLEMVGGFAPGHGAYGTFPCVTLDPAHAAMLSVGNRFEITDEPYIIDRRDPDVEVLIRTEKTIEVAGKERKGPEPQVWTKRVGRGRVFAVTFGHDEKSQGDERFITLLHNGIRWAAGRLEGAKHNVLTPAERQSGFRLLFNGRDLDGWTGDVGNWKVENGELVGRTTSIPHNQFLIHREEFDNFVLRFSVRLRNHNSGVQFRSRAFPEHVVKGYQADIADSWYGSLYEEGGKRGVLANGWKGKGEKVVVLDGWNDMCVKAVGSMITIMLNGVTTVEYEEKDTAAQPARGVIALQLHTGPPMEVRFRDIRIHPLPKSEGEPSSQ